MRSTPIILLKTQSADDAYDKLIRALPDYNPIFVPVLEYDFVNREALKELVAASRILPVDGQSSSSDKDTYGALIFTSQRAVEALGDVFKDVSDDRVSQLLNAKVYVVGPATKNAVINLGFKPNHVLGAESGNGAALAEFIKQDYNSSRPLLFLVGEVRRDVIPKTLAAHIPPVVVEEMVVYESRQSKAFENELRGVLDALDQVHQVGDDLGQKPVEETRWIVVFSPSGAREVMGVVEERRKLEDHVKYRICTIGPTTWDHLVNECYFQPDTVASTPSPEGLMEEIRRF